MKMIKLRPLLLIFLMFIQCSVEEVQPSLELVQNSNVQKVLDPSNSNSENSTESSQTTNQNSFDHQGMLKNWADNIIIPALSNFEDTLFELKDKAILYTDDPTPETLSNVREAWLLSYLKWQHVEMFDIGKAEEIYFKNRINLYPANIEKIESNITNQDYDLDQSSNFTSQGFNSLDYLLFGIAEDENAILSKYSSISQNYDSYLIDLIDKMIELTAEVSESWDVQFRQSFISSTENTATSSVNKVINDFIFYFEKGFRANKVGIPAGVFSDKPLPDRVEAYHSKEYSKVLAIEANQSIKDFFNGISYNDKNAIGLSISDYLDYIELEDISKLSNKINEQLDTINVKLTELDSDFSVQITEDNLAMLYAFDAIQANVVLLKVDMLQKLNINVDYADADGD